MYLLSNVQDPITRSLFWVITYSGFRWIFKHYAPVNKTEFCYICIHWQNLVDGTQHWLVIPIIILLTSSFVNWDHIDDKSKCRWRGNITLQYYNVVLHSLMLKTNVKWDWMICVHNKIFQKTYFYKIQLIKKIMDAF